MVINIPIKIDKETFRKYDHLYAAYLCDCDYDCTCKACFGVVWWVLD